METVYLSLGSDRGDRKSVLSRAEALILDNRGAPVKISGRVCRAAFKNTAARVAPRSWAMRKKTVRTTFCRPLANSARVSAGLNWAPETRP